MVVVLLAGMLSVVATSVEFPPHLKKWDIVFPPPARRIALVVGNADYKRINKLPGVIADANAVGRLLVCLGFEVTKALDVSSRKAFLVDVFLPFVEGIKEGDFVVFYFSGYGFFFNGSTYLVPIAFSQSVPESKAFGTFISEDALRGLINRVVPFVTFFKISMLRGAFGV